MKNILIIILLMAFVSCDDFLKETPETQISTEQFFKTPGDAFGIVNGIYTIGVANYFGNPGFEGSSMMMSGYMSGFFDNGRKGEGVGAVDAQTLTIDPIRMNGYFVNWWSGGYEAISRANSAIKYIPEIEGFKEGEANQLMGEARFFRAYNYFYLVKNFGDVPLITEPYESLENIYRVRDNAKLVYDQIVEDLNWALDNGGLPDDLMHSNGYRITKGVVATVLADVYLQMAGYPLKEEGNYAKAANAARVVINSGTYELISHGDSLDASAYNVMRTSNTEKEYIYPIEFDATLRVNSLPMVTIPESSKFSESKFTYQFNGYGPIDKFLLVYDTDKDLRAQNRQSFYHSIEVNGIFYEYGEWATYLWFDRTALFETGRSGMDVRAYRYAEILLIAAEAIAFNEGVTDEVVSYLADVRARAYWQTDRSEIVNELAGLSKDQFIKEVWKERLRELALDYRIWSDIQRTRMYPEPSEANPGEVNFGNVIDHSNNWGVSYQESDLLFCLPDNELQRNPELIQNPGY